MLGLPTSPKFLIAPLVLALIIVFLHIGEPATANWLGFYPHLVLEGQWWRVVTGQLLHTNTNHMLLNLAGLGLVWALHGEYYRARHFAVINILSLVLIGFSLMLFVEYGHYAGLSGVLHSLLIYGAFIDINRGDRSGWLLMTGVIGKVLYETLIGPSKDTEAMIDAAVAFEAHVLGVIAGALLGLAYLYRPAMFRQPD